MEHNLGWIKLPREIRQSWLYNDLREFSKFEAFIDLLMDAAYKEKTIDFAGTLIFLKRGQLATTTNLLCDRWRWNPKRVRVFLDNCAKDNLITRSGTNKYTVIEITDFDKYQGNNKTDQGQTETKENQGFKPGKGQTEGQAKGQAQTKENQGFGGSEGQAQGQTEDKQIKDQKQGQTETNENQHFGPGEGQTEILEITEKEGQAQTKENQGFGEGEGQQLKKYKEKLKEDKEIYINKFINEINLIYFHYCNTYKDYIKRYSLTEKRKLLIADRLSEGFKVNECLDAIENIKLSPWHMGQHHENNNFVISIEIIFKDTESLEKWINFKPGPTVLKPNNSTFHNFDQRSINFDELEKKFIAAQNGEVAADQEEQEDTDLKSSQEYIKSLRAAAN